VPIKFQFMLDADTCLAPEEGAFAPEGLVQYTRLVRDLVLNDTGNQTVLQVVMQPSFTSPYSLRLEQPSVARPTGTKVVPVAAGLANRLTAVWAGALAHTQYANEVTVAPDGSSVGSIRADGTTFHFWHDDRSGTTHSPREGTLLGDLVDVVETLTRHADAAPAAQPALLKQLHAALAGLRRRLARSEPWLRPQSPHARDG
jgi:hypothetical protein